MQPGGVASFIADAVKMLLHAPAIGPDRIYGPRVVTDKNIGRDYGLSFTMRSTGEGHWRKAYGYPRNSRYMPHQGERERARRLRKGRL